MEKEIIFLVEEAPEGFRPRDWAILSLLRLTLWMNSREWFKTPYNAILR